MGWAVRLVNLAGVPQVCTGSSRTGLRKSGAGLGGLTAVMESFRAGLGLKAGAQGWRAGLEGSAKAPRGLGLRT